MVGDGGDPCMEALPLTVAEGPVPVRSGPGPDAPDNGTSEFISYKEFLLSNVGEDILCRPACQAGHKNVMKAAGEGQVATRRVA
jgi:hypothetical protein